MKKFLVVGLGGSGGATVRYVMDQLRADLRRRGVTELPQAWQFLHIDVNPVPEQTPGLGDIRALGGRYVAVGAAGKNFDAARRTVEHRLANENSLNSLAGWVPNPRQDANLVPVATGAGQYRGVGRILTLNNLARIEGAIHESYEALQSVSAWGELSNFMDDEGPFNSSGSVVPIVISSMAGGAGASMFLDVCRLLGRVSGIDSSQLGVFLFTPDVFSSLDPSKRQGIDGNALAALGELLSAQMRSNNALDQELFKALGVSLEENNAQVFRRVFPIGSFIGGDGARFGDTNEDIYRGLGRALAATMISNAASEQYVKTKIENHSSVADGQEILGWGVQSDEVAWGSFGYSSLSLGRDRYAHYASQRLARQCVDQLTRGFLDVTSTLPPTEHLESLVANQWEVILGRLQLTGTARAQKWLSSGPLQSSDQNRVAAEVISDALAAISQLQRDDKASAWLESARKQLPVHERKAAATTDRLAYTWAISFAEKLESTVLKEVVRLASHPRQGLPFARKVLEKLDGIIRDLAAGLEKAPRKTEVLSLDGFALGKAQVSDQVVELLREKMREHARDVFECKVALWAAQILESFANEVLPSMINALNDAHDDLAVAMEARATDAGLAQLHTTRYLEWPSNSDLVPTRFDEAHNEVLLTTTSDFPQRFREHVEASSSGVNFEDGLNTITQEIVRGSWENVGAQQAEFEVAQREVHWRSPVLKIDPETGDPTPQSRPRYRFAFTTGEILERASAYQARKDQAFERFSSETFEGYLNEPGIADSERQRRQKELVIKFEEATAQAAPLVGVNPPAVEALHKLKLQVEYTFGSIPLSESSPVVVEIQKMLERRDHIEIQSRDRFKDALDPENPISRIAIFGSYPSYYPLVYTSFLKQLKDRWSGASEQAKRQLWMWKRTRAIPGAIGMGRAEMSAMIKGWYLGRVLGLVHQPSQGDASDKAMVYDTTSGNWYAFDPRMLTSREQFKRDNSFDWLPAILEAHTLALVNSANDPTFGPLRPYQVLRGIYDNGVQPAARETTSGEQGLKLWLETGQFPSGTPSEVKVFCDTEDSFQSRVGALRQWLQTIADYIEREYLTNPTGPTRSISRKLRVDSPDALEDLDLFAEVSRECYDAIQDLSESLDRLEAKALGEEVQHAAPQI